MIRPLLLATALILPVAAAAQDDARRDRTIRVMGSGTVETAPDVARIDYWVRGEGATPDAATAALAQRQKAIAAGVTGLLGGQAEVTTANVTVIEVRDKACDDNRGYGSNPRLSQGACAIVGHLATMQAGVKTRAVDKSATAVGLASRLGASDARLAGFELSNPADAKRRATVAAIADAKARAETLAAGAGARLGELVSVSDQSGGGPAEMVVTGSRPAAAPPPPPPPPPVAIDIKPRPIETRQQVYVAYSIAP
ncbi:hypothetical protein ASG29_08865 [Sphingomonas sp. Leaf412]|uniref:SIMPL domain-containing protein n=1 Tax=Sphingomonas sp. Leaf412 TaxID=1736370 RepID=UPI0006FA24EF|nr:SIMPL domain-containing protein [Sphingomonas sp. Leaf412]KQT31967.1 hypothetical protein ASG29_08865 [Sphingomonas sp. Leaf412]